MNIAAGAAKYLSGFTFKFWLAVCAALVACLPVAYCKGRSDGITIEQGREAKAVVKGHERAGKANDAADVRQEAADTKNAANDAARQEVIDNAPDDKTDAAGRALACERLRQAGKAAPAACAES